MHRNIPRSKIVKAFSELGKPTSIKKIYETNNIIYKVVADNKVYVIKIYDTKAPGKDRELLVLRKIPNIPHARELIKYEEDTKTIGHPFAIFPHIDGSTLHEALDKGLSTEKAKEYAVDIANIIKSLSKFKTKGLGEINDNIEGTESSWYDHITGFIEKNDLPILSKILPKELVEKIKMIMYANVPKEVKPTLIPFDLNSHNFLIEKGRLRMVDIGAVIVGDWIFPLGEFMNHYYMTPLWEPFIANFKLSKEERKIMHTYALISNFDVLRAAIVMAGADYKTAKPWGNKHTFLELMDLHLKALDSGDY